jgi:hypothetical protein
MPFFKKLSTAQQETFGAHSTAQLLSQFLHGEQGALLTAATIAHGVPDVKAKVLRRGRRRWTKRVMRSVRTLREENRDRLSDDAVAEAADRRNVSTENYMKVMIGMNMIVEGLALGAFNNMYKQTEEQLLKSITFNVMRDESRHVSFGHIFPDADHREDAPDEREELAQFAYDAVKILVKGQTGMDPGFLKVLAVAGIDPQDFANGMQEADALGITRQLPRDRFTH